MMVEEKTAIVTLTKKGLQLGLKVKTVFKCTDIDIYSPDKFKNNQKVENQEEINYYDFPLKELTAKLFEQYKNIVYIMALGIVVRVIAPYLVSKRVDPAVVTIDETGQNVISTLSGHLGGANKLTEKTAKIIGANSVTTTATDCQGKMAIDLLAKRLDCIIEPFENLKIANACIVNDKPLNIFTDYNIGLKKTENISVFPLPVLSKNVRRGFPVIISNKNIKVNGDYLQLIPRNVIIGIGCRKGISVKKIKLAVGEALDFLNIKERSIKNLATIDLKKDEAGLMKYAEQKSLKVDIIDRNKINNANLDISKSEFVQKTVGVPGVCEPSALLSANKGKLILPKTKYDQVTVAVAEEGIYDGK